MITIGIFLFVHSIYFLGAAIFKQNAFIKMTIATTLFAVLVALIFGITMGYLDHRSNISLKDSHIEINNPKELLTVLKYSLIVLTPVLWGIAYLRLKETEL